LHQARDLQIKQIDSIAIFDKSIIKKVMISTTTTASRGMLQLTARRRVPTSRLLGYGSQQQYYQQQQQQRLSSSSSSFASLPRPSFDSSDKEEASSTTASAVADVNSHQRLNFSIASSFRGNVCSTNIWNRGITATNNMSYQVAFFSTSSTKDAANSVPVDNMTDNDESKSDHHHHSADEKQTVRERAAQYRERAREKAVHYKDQAREQASHYADEARGHAKSFGGMMKLYGPFAVGTYFSAYVITLGSLYAGVESGVLDPVSLLGYISGNPDDARSTAMVVAEMLEKYTLTEHFAETVRQKPALANFAVAWATTKFTEPIRLAFTVAVTPRVARYFGGAPKKIVTDDEKDANKKEEETK